jgi:hypothetical protein
MPGYVAAALHKYQHTLPTRAQYAPYRWNAPNYGAKQQLTTPTDETAPLDAQGITRMQQVTGTLLFYARAVDSTILVALGTISAQQSDGTEAIAEAVAQLSD